MKSFAILAMLLVAGAFAFDRDPNSWTFDMQGEWPLFFPTCLGMSQSPINIEPSGTIPRKFEDNLKFKRIDSLYPNMNIIYTNRTIRVTAPYVKKASIKIWFDDLGNTYYFDHLHFHLGLKDYDGSEHAINSRKYPSELHYVWVKKNFGSLSDALASSDPEAVVTIGVLYKIGEDNDEALHPIIQAIGNGETSTSSDLDLNSLLEPVINTPFYTYLGSLESPGCNEVIRWIVYKKILEISYEQLNTLRKVKFNGVDVFPNFRFLQPCNRRPQYFYK